MNYPIITNEFCVEEIERVKGIPSARKPNRYRPFYIKAKIKKPIAYAIKGRGVICHPSILKRFSDQQERETGEKIEAHPFSLPLLFGVQPFAPIITEPMPDGLALRAVARYGFGFTAAVSIAKISNVS